MCDSWSWLHSHPWECGRSRTTINHVSSVECRHERYLWCGWNLIFVVAKVLLPQYVIMWGWMEKARYVLYAPWEAENEWRTVDPCVARKLVRTNWLIQYFCGVYEMKFWSSGLIKLFYRTDSDLWKKLSQTQCSNISLRIFEIYNLLKMIKEEQ